MSNWRPGQKLGVYLALAFLTAFLSGADKLTNEIIAAYTWWDWLKFTAGILMPVGITWRAFIDQSVSRTEADNANKL